MTERALSAWSTAQKLGGQLATGLAVIGAEATATGYAIFHLTEKYEEHIKKSRLIGKANFMTPQNAARLQYAAGDDTEAVLKARGFFDKAKNTKNAGSAFKQLGLDPKELNGLTLTNQLLKVGDALKNYKGGDGPAIVKALLGKGGAGAVPFLTRGSDVIKKQFGDADSFGLTPTDEQIAKNAEYAASMKKLGGAIDGVKYSIGEAFLPVVEKFGDAFSEFMQKNGPDFRKWLSEISEEIVKFVPTSEQIKTGFDSLKSVMQWFSEHPTTLDVTLGAIASLPLAPFFAGVLAIAASPVTAGIVALGAAFYTVSQAFKDIKNNWSDLTNLEGWKGFGKDFLQNDPILGKLFKPNDAADTQKMRKTGNPSPSATPSSKSSTTQHNTVTINVHPTPGMDTHALARMVYEHFEGRLAAVGGGALYDA